MKWVLVLPALVVSSACSEVDPGRRFSSVDEGGVTRAVTYEPEWTDVRPLEASLLSRFESDEAGGALLSRIRSAELLSDGGVVVLDERSGQLIDYAPSGRVRRIVGRRGDGPGEFRSPRTLSVLRGDSLAVYDARANRIAVFGPGGGAPEIHALEPLVGVPPLDVWLRSRGRVVSFEGSLRGAAILASTPVGNTVGALAVVRRVDLDTGRADTLHADGIALEVFVRGDMPIPLPFPRNTWTDVQDDVVAVAPSTGFELRRFGPDGEILEASMPSGERPMDDAELDGLRDSARAVAAETGQPFIGEAAFESSLQPDVRPSFAAVRVASDGRMLAREFEPLGVRSSVWWLVSPEGRFRGRLRVPHDVDVLRFYGDRILWVRRDAFDVPSVELVEVDWSATLEGTGS